MDYSKLDLRRADLPCQKNKPGRIVIQGNECLQYPPAEAVNRINGIRLSVEGGSFVIDYDDLSTGTMIVGATGCGKTTLFFKILDNIIANLGQNDIVIIFDSKRDYLERYYVPSNPNHIVVSVSEKDELIAREWNLFEELINENGQFGKDKEIRAGEISKGLFREMESESQPFFNLAAEDIFSKTLSSILRNAANNGDLSKLNNNYLYKFLSGASTHSIIELTGRYTDYKYLNNYVGDGSSNQALGVYGYLMAMKNRNLSLFHDRKSAGKFSMQRLVREKGKKIVFMEYDIRYAESLSVMYSLFYDLAIKQALGGSSIGNTYFICDELNLLPYISQLQNLLNFGRSKGCKTLLGLQSVSQLYDNYGEKEGTAILAGCLTSVCFNCVETETRDYIKKRFGETLDLFNYGGNNFTSPGYTVTDSDIKNLHTGEAFVDMKGLAPFKVRFTK